MVLIYVSLMSSYVDNLFMYLLAWYNFFEEMSIQVPKALLILKPIQAMSNVEAPSLELLRAV